MIFRIYHARFGGGLDVSSPIVIAAAAPLIAVTI
jgi:hypothetical protein